MRSRGFPLLAVALLSAAGCGNPNSYKRWSKGFGYDGFFFKDTPEANAGFASFTGDEEISRQQTRMHCWRRISQLCRRRGFEYFTITQSRTLSGQALKREARYAGRYTGAYGMVYDRWRVWHRKVRTSGMLLEFRAYRGPMPPSGRGTNYYSVKEVLSWSGGSNAPPLKPRAVACAWCKRTVDAVAVPEHCPHCKRYVFGAPACPRCHGAPKSIAGGIANCGKCAKTYHASRCPHCRRAQSLFDNRGYTCTYCKGYSETWVVSGGARFPCAHGCGANMEWPRERFGEYQCTGCRKVFTVHACPKCRKPHALSAWKNFTCVGCGQVVPVGPKTPPAR